MAAAAIGVEGFRTGMVAVVQTAGETLAVNPHVHALAPRGGWDAAGQWVPIPYVDTNVAERLFRHKVLSFLSAEGLLSEERAALLLSWEHHTGFSVDASVRFEPEDGPGLERLARYILRPPVNLARLSFKEGWDEVIQDLKPRRGQPRGEERVDALEYLARAIVHNPEPRLHTLRYMGHYSNVARGRRRKERDPELEPMRDTPPGCEEPEDLSAAERRARRRAWANLVRRVFEVDPLICKRCGAEMKIISVILDPEVIDAILRHLRRTKTSEARAPPQARRPPQPGSELRPAS